MSEVAVLWLFTRIFRNFADVFASCLHPLRMRYRKQQHPQPDMPDEACRCTDDRNLQLFTEYE